MYFFSLFDPIRHEQLEQMDLKNLTATKAQVLMVYELWRDHGAETSDAGRQAFYDGLYARSIARGSSGQAQGTILPSLACSVLGLPELPQEGRGASRTQKQAVDDIFEAWLPLGTLPAPVEPPAAGEAAGAISDETREVLLTLPSLSPSLFSCARSLPSPSRMHSLLLSSLPDYLCKSIS